VDNVETKVDVIGLTKDKGKGIKDKQDTLKAKGGGRDKG